MIGTDYKVPVFDSIKQAWLRVHGTKSVFIATFLLIVVFSLVSAYLSVYIDGQIKSEQLSPPYPIYIIAIQIGYYVLQFFVLEYYIGMIYMGVQVAQGRPLNYSMMNYGFQHIWLIFQVLGCYILMGLPILVPFIFLIVPSFITVVIGIILFIFYYWLLIRLILAPIVVIAEDSNPWYAVKRSFSLTQSNAWRLLGLFLLTYLIICLGALTLGIGFIWIIPLVFILKGVIYNRFITQS